MNDEDKAKQGEKLPWTDERVNMLKQLREEGLSASQIAKRLGGGATRNSVIGKMHRLGLPGRPQSSRPAARRQAPRSRKPNTASRASAPRSHGATALKTQLAPRPEPEPAPAPIHLVDLSRGGKVTILMLSNKTCRWPIGEPNEGDFCFCGHEPKEGSPYCDYHTKVAYQPASERRRQKSARR